MKCHIYEDIKGDKETKKKCSAACREEKNRLEKSYPTDCEYKHYYY